MIPSPEPTDRARALFTWLWMGKPARYRSRGPFRLDDVIDAQLNEQCETVGNCLGLTLLYNCLIKRLTLKAEAVHLERTFETGPHVLTELQIGDSFIDVENILPHGFDYKGHLDDPSRTKWGDRELVADIYLSLGNESFLQGQFVKALQNYDSAIDLNPQYEKARLNKAILLDKMKTIS